MITILSQINDELQTLKRAIKERAYAAVAAYVKSAPGQYISLQGHCGFAMVLNEAGEWVETAIQAVRFKGGGLEITTSLDIDEDDNDAPYWGEDSVYTDGDDYCTIDWLSILDAIAESDKEAAVSFE